MARPQTYLVALDSETESNVAVERAAWYASCTGAKLSLFLPEYVQAIDLEPGLREKLVAGNRARLQRSAERLERRGLEADIDVRWERPLDDAILHKVADSGAALVFRDTQYHSALQRALFSSVEWSLIRRCQVPLWLVKGAPIGASPRVLAAVDTSHAHGKTSSLDEEILNAAKRVARATAGELQVVHVIQPISATAALSATGAPEAAGAFIAEELYDDGGEERRVAALEQLVAKAGIERSRIRVERGTPSSQLIQAAEELKADIVVMGAVSRNRLQNLFIGNTAERVLDRMPCDLLVVKDPQASGGGT
jgi:universal stress protein E